MQHPRLVLLVVAGLSFAGVATAAAQKKAVKPCGITAVPLSVGNTWTYEAVDYPAPTRGTDGEKKKELDAREAAAKLYPNAAEKIVITVTAMETAKDGVTTIKLSEQIDDRTLETSLTCTASTLTASLDSFFYAGEPGGSWNLGFDKIERKGQTLPLVGGKLSGTEWHDDFKAAWKRTATASTGADLGSGTITVKRRMVMLAEEPALETTAGAWAKSTKLGIETTGNVTIDGTGTAKPYELPAGLVTYLYFVDGVGLARVENTFFHAYQLASFTVAK
jgi:hypothetical protein